jgi:hypothetical protein
LGKKWICKIELGGGVIFSKEIFQLEVFLAAR